MSVNVKNSLISFYYLLEIIKLRKVSYNIDKNLTSANNIIKEYNRIIGPYKDKYKEQMEEQKKRTKSMVIPPIKINYEKFAKSMDISIDLIRGKPLKELISIMKKIIAKRKEKEIAEKKTTVIKPVVKL